MTATGGTVGGQVGYRWQAGTCVFGLEAQGNWADFSGSNVSAGWTRASRNHTNVDAFGLFTGQVGYACQQRPALRQGRCCRDLEQLSR